MWQEGATAEAKTRQTSISVDDFLGMITPDDKRADALALDGLFRKATGFLPRMWGPTIVGYGRYAYTYDSGHAGESLATGFSPRTAAHSLYIGAGDGGAAPFLARLGSHKVAKSCLYIKRLSDVDSNVLEALIRRGLEQLGQSWQVYSE